MFYKAIMLSRTLQIYFLCHHSTQWWTAAAVKCLHTSRNFITFMTIKNTLPLLWSQPSFTTLTSFMVWNVSEFDTGGWGGGGDQRIILWSWSSLSHSCHHPNRPCWKKRSAQKKQDPRKCDINASSNSPQNVSALCTKPVTSINWYITTAVLPSVAVKQWKTITHLWEGSPWLFLQNIIQGSKVPKSTPVWN